MSGGRKNRFAKVSSQTKRKFILKILNSHGNIKKAAKEYKINYSTAKTIFRLFRANQLKDDLGDDMPCWRAEAPELPRLKRHRVRCLVRPVPQQVQEIESASTPQASSTQPSADSRLFKSSFRRIQIISTVDNCS